METRLCSRQVQASEGEKLAQRNGAAWIETSAKNNINVGEYYPCLRRLLFILQILYWTQGRYSSFALENSKSERLLIMLSLSQIGVLSCRVSPSLDYAFTLCVILCLSFLSVSHGSSIAPALHRLLRQLLNELSKLIVYMPHAPTLESKY
jgi:hypothetical protein